MNLEYLLLPVGLVLLVVPTAVVCGPKMRERLDQPARRRNEGLTSLLRSRINWIDLIRGVAGAWLVQKPFQDSISPQDELATTFLAVQMAVIFMGALAQTLWLHRPARVIGPIFFLTGLTIALSGPMVGGFGLVTGFSCALIFGRLSTVFCLVPIALAAFGLLFHELGVMTVFNAGIFALPAFLAFTLGIRISFVRRSATVTNRVVGTVPSVEVEATPEVGSLIRPDFTHPLAAEPVQLSAQSARETDVLAPLPDFLRIAEEEPERPRRRTHRRLFARRRA